MVITFNDLASKYENYTDIKGKIRREVKSKRLIQIKKGLYENNPHADGKYLASYIYGPSYLSLDYVLSYYSLIPEAVFNVYTSVTFNKCKTKKYTNEFGLFTYQDVPASIFSLGVEIHQENGYSYKMATLEKALCDKLYSLSPVSSLKELKALLFDYLRIDENDLFSLNLDDIKRFAPLYHSKNLDYLVKLIGGNK